MDSCVHNQCVCVVLGWRKEAINRALKDQEFLMEN